MTHNVTAEELEAILEPSAPASRGRRAAAAFALRDFKRPRRLSPAALQRLQRTAEKAAPEIAGALAVWFRRAVAVEIASIDEVDAHELLRGWSDPACVLAFETAGLPGWLAWDAAAAVGAAEVALGSTSAEAPLARPLSPVERTIVQGLLAKVATVACRALGVEAKGLRLAGSLAELGSLDELPRDADSRRLSVEITIASAGATSALRLHVAGVAAPADGSAPAAAAKEKPRASVPAHLGPVEVEVGARLGSVDVALADLLALEVGDVLLLGVDRGCEVDLYVEGERCARARFGEREGRLAVRIEEVGSRIGREEA